jgi:[CysO sulfur-carrier protein]-S-L-cysteine hydrolase
VVGAKRSDTLVLPLALARELLEHARAEVPNEACGILAGDLASGRASAYHPARNADASPYVYTVHPDDLLRIVLGIDDAGEDLLAIFHSHLQTPAVPSPTDRRNARYPDAFYLLATLSDGGAAPRDALRAWRIVDGESREVSLAIA